MHMAKFGRYEQENQKTNLTSFRDMEGPKMHGMQILGQEGISTISTIIHMCFYRFLLPCCIPCVLLTPMTHSSVGTCHSHDNFVRFWVEWVMVMSYTWYHGMVVTFSIYLTNHSQLEGHGEETLPIYMLWVLFLGCALGYTEFEWIDDDAVTPIPLIALLSLVSHWLGI